MSLLRRKYEDVQDSQEEAYDPHIEARLKSNDTSEPDYFARETERATG